MSSKDQNLSSTEELNLDGSGLKIGIVTSEWNSEITDSLEKACKVTLLDNNVLEEHIECIKVPGSFELPLGAKILLSKERLDAVICLGCVIKGETKHDQYIPAAVATAIAQLNLLASKPIIFGVLTPENMEQAKDRAGGKHGNKGVEAATTAIRMAKLHNSASTTNQSIGFNR